MNASSMPARYCPSPELGRGCGNACVAVGGTQHRRGEGDPALGRFVQADSIIPNPGDPASYDRYSYVRNNPVRYTDPSGHRYCSSRHATEDVDCSYTAERILNDFYGITFKRGDTSWANEDIRAIYIAAATIGTKLIPFVSNANSAGGAFSAVFGGLSLSLDRSISPMDGRASANSISLRPGRVTSRLFGHELSHVFALRMWEGAGGKYTDSHPEVMLQMGLYDDSGLFMTGEDRRGDGTYRRNDLQTGYLSGYSGDTVPDQYHWMSVTNPGEMMDADSNTAGEEWADMFLNWGMGGFNDSPRGQFYEAWMTTNMSEWISMAGGQ